MKRFQFSMQKILDLRKFEQQQAEAELGKANAEVARIQRELDLIAQKRVATIKTFDTETDFAVVAQIQQFFSMMDIKKEQFLQEIAQAQMRADQKRQVVLECMKKTKALEKLREKHLERWKKDVNRREQLVIDDIVNAKAYGNS